MKHNNKKSPTTGLLSPFASLFYSQRARYASLAGAAAVLTVAAYAMFAALPGRIRLAPVSIAVHSASSLPAEVQALEAQTAPLLFDRDTHNAHVAYADQSIDARLDRPTEIRAVKIYGASPYVLTVLAQQGSGWAPIAGLSQLKLSALSPSWNEFTANQPITTQTLRFEFTMTSAGGNAGGGNGGGKGKGNAKGSNSTASSGGIAEIEIWGTGDHALLGGSALVAAMPAAEQQSNNQQPLPAQARSYSATPQQAVIGKDGQRFTITLDRPAARFKRAWLSYEAWGVSHWVSPARRINGQAWQGGAFVFAGGDWRTLTEPIHPAWLKAGSNAIDLALPAGVAGSYTVRNLRVVGELDDGANFIARATTTVTGVENDAPALIDGDLISGWSPYADPRGKGPTAQPQLTLYFDRSTQLDSLSLNLVNAIGGTLSLDLLVGGQWQSAGLQTLNGRKVSAGWNQLSGFAPVAADAVRVTFLNGTGSPGEVREISASGSGVGGPDTPDIVVAYPDAGQFYGRQAYLRGYLSVPDNGSGPATLSVAGKAAPSSDGSFGVLISKDDAGFANQADGEPWQVQLDAIYPDGQKLTRIVRLDHGYDAAKARGQLPAGLNLGAAIVLAAAEAGLDIEPDALQGDEKIQITPLSEEQLPRLDPGMTNVTKGPRRGYRFTPTPHKFKKAIRVTLPYDPALIPRGLSEADIKTYYFDKQAGRWVALDRAHLDTGKKRLTSLTDHFTDMINATLTVPDHPQTVSFNPTQLKDIKAADPGAGINLIEPPRANNQGDARLSYPIEIPPGRAGMQPQLAIQYNSGAAGGNGGWLGLGWDLSVPSIGIETRWGVPRYDLGDATANPPRPAKESETYTLNGEQLVPLDADGKPGLMPHRAAWDRLENRSAGDKRYLARVEGAFRKIVRHGSNPNNYWWEVTDKNGTRHFYGGVDGSDASGKLGGNTDGGKGVFKWMLRKSVDRHGNAVLYEYERVCDTGVGSGVCGMSGYVDGYQLYLKQIRYTDHPSLGAPYRVEFTREAARRADVSIDARGGFKQVTAHRLQTITVNYGEQTVRSYELVYNRNAYGSGDSNSTDTAFGKTLLTAVVQKGADGAEFNRHAFEYFDEVRQGDGSTLALFNPQRQTVDAQKDRLAPSFADPLLAQLLAQPQTLVGGSLGVNAGFNGFLGIGWVFQGRDIHVGVTASGNASYSQSNLALIDIDGDGRPDKVFERDGTVYYRKNTSNVATGTVSFQGGDPSTVQGVSRLGDNQSLSWGVGVKGQVLKATAYAKSNRTVTTDAVYFADVNGDGLVDQVNNRTVNFNRRLGDGQYAFNAQSTGTPMPIRAGTIDAGQLLSAMAAERAAMESANPLMDAVRRWVAPYDGRITISGDVRLHNFRTDATLSPGERDRRQRYETADGVRVSIQHGDAELWAADIGAEDYAVKSPGLIQGRQIRKGEVIYFRVHSKYDGNYDRVHWAPRIDYLDAAGQPMEYADANQRNAYLYRGDADHVLASGRGLRMGATNYGTVRIDGQLQKTDMTSDDVTLVVEVSQSVEDGQDSQGNVKSRIVPFPEKGFTRTLKWNETGVIDLKHSVEVEKGYSIAIRIASDSPIDLSKLRWLGEGSPKLYYTYAYEPEVQVKHPLKDQNQSATSSLPSSADAVDPDKIAMPTDGGVIPRRDLPVKSPDGQWRYQIQASYDADIYSASTEGASPQAPWVAPRDGVILISPWVKLKTYAQDCGPGGEGGASSCSDVAKAPDGDIALTVKRNGALAAKQIVQVRNKAVVLSSQGYAALQAVAVKAGDRLFIDFSARDPLLAQEIEATDAYFAYGSAGVWQSPLSDTVGLRAVLQASVGESSAGASVAGAGTVLFVARRGTEIVERKEFTVQNYAQLEHQFTRAVQAGEGYSFDFLTVDPNISVSKREVWVTYTGVAPWSAPRAGVVTVQPRLNFSRAISGAVSLNVVQNGRLSASRTYNLVDGALAAGQMPLTLSVAAGDSLRFEYLVQDHALSSALADKGAVALDYAQATNWTVPAGWMGAASTLTVQPGLSLKPGAAGAVASGQVSLRVWRGAELLADVPYSVADGQIVTGASLPLTLSVSEGEVLGFEYASASQDLLDALARHDVALSAGANSATLTVALKPASVTHGSQALTIRMPELFWLHPKQDSVRHYAVFNDLYGNPYRGWSYIGYNSQHSDVGAPASKPLVQTQLKLGTRAEIKDPNNARPAYIAVPSGRTLRWESLDDNWWISADQISSSRRGVDQINVPDAASFAASGNVVRVPRRSSGNTFSAGGGYYLTINFSNGRSGGELDLIDLNGDRYPDVIGGGHVQYTEPGGSLAETLPVLGATNVTATDNISFSIGPGPQVSPESARALQQFLGNTQDKAPEKNAMDDFPVNAGIDSGNSNVQIQLADINGDGLPDQLLRESGGLKVRLNMGYGFADAEPWDDAPLNHSATVGLSIEGFSYSSNDGKTQLTDLNGDGLPDRVDAGSNGELKVSFNTGKGFGPQRIVSGFVQTYPFIPGDLAAQLPGGTHTTLYDGASLSYGKNFGFTTGIPIPCPLAPCFDLVFGGGVNVGATMTQPTIALRDIDGDGLPDGIRSPSSDKAEVARNQTGKTNLLKTIRRPLGALMTLDYARSGNTYEQPHSKWVMSRVSVFDGVADDTPSAWLPKASDWQHLSFAYADGQYDRYERDFLGYGEVTTRVHDTAGKHGLSAAAELSTTPELRRSEQSYATDSVYAKGQLREETTLDARSGHTLGRSVHQYDYWRITQLNPGTQAAAGTAVHLDTLAQFPEAQAQDSRATAVVFPRLKRTDKHFFETGISQLSSHTAQDYDAWGNVSFFEEGGTGVEPVQAQIAYSASHGADALATCQANHIIGLPTDIMVMGGAQQMRHRVGRVLCASGKLEWQRAHYVDHSGAATYAQTDFTWDAWGNLDTIQGPANHQGQRLKLSYAYDRDTRTYPETITNESYGLSSSATYDYKWGKPLSTTDANGNVIGYTYDAYGRTMRVLGPQERNKVDWTIQFSYHDACSRGDLQNGISAGGSGQPSGCLSWAKTEHADRQVLPDGSVSYQADPIDTILFADGAKHALQTKKDASVAAGDGNSAAATPSMIASGRVVADVLGRTVAQYHPTAAPKGASDSQFIATPDAAAPTTTEYDAQDRPVLTTLPDGSQTRMAYGFASDASGQTALQTQVIDALGNKKQSLRNVRGAITAVTEYNRPLGTDGQPQGAPGSGVPSTTKYAYDPLKQITQVIDAKGNTTTVQYDQLGRRTVIDNPDTGRVQTVYDAASNPVRKITARLVELAAKNGSLPYIEYGYDHTRLLSITHPVYPDANVSYTYGTSSDKTRNQAGRIKQVQHQSGLEVREYGSLGEVVKQTLTLTAAANGGSTPPVYTTAYDFDSFGRLHRLTNPDGELIVNRYDSGGNLQSVHGRLNGAAYEYLKSLTYDRFESRVRLELANGMVTRYSYDPKTRRLDKLQAGKGGTAAGNDLQDLNYSYDQVGNILKLKDEAPIPKSNEFGGASEQNFRYDDLYRLIKADGVYKTAREAQTYKLDLAFDEIHNITHKTQEHKVFKGGGVPIATITPSTEGGRIERATSYDWAYAYGQRQHKQPHAPTQIGNRTFDYDANGNQSGWQNLDNGTRRTIVWDEDNRIREVQDPKHGAAFSYDDRGERKLKKSQYGETAYINQFFTVRNGAIASTHVYAGTTRIATKVGAGTPVGKVKNGNIQGTGNIDPATASLTEYVAPDGSTTTVTPTTLAPLGRGQGEGQARRSATTSDKGQSATPATFPGQGLEHRSDRANEVARNTEKNKHLNGGDPGGEQGSVNSQAGGHESNAGGNGNKGNAWGRTGERGNSGQTNADHNPLSRNAGEGRGEGGAQSNAGGQGNGSTTGNGGGSATGNTGGTGDGREFIYFYHPDHLGSSAYVTDEKAQRYEHLAYFPFGETWVQESTATWRVPYQYTAKEMDSETGLYYFGARYFDPRTSVWQSADPILASYLNGGVFAPSKLSLFIYSAHNPIRYVDPDGNDWVDSGDGNNPYKWVDSCSNGQTCYAERAAAVSGTFYHYGSDGKVTSYAANDNGYFDMSKVSGFSGRKMLDVKAGNHHYQTLDRAVATYNQMSDYFSIFSNDSAFMLIEESKSNGRQPGGHKTHNFGRSYDYRYKDAGGNNIHDPEAVNSADPARTYFLNYFGRKYGYDQNYIGSAPSGSGDIARVLGSPSWFKPLDGAHNNHGHMGQSAASSARERRSNIFLK